jgi:sulfotransferase
MQNGIHFVSGLPRAGSTLLSALLRQNPALHANITSPLGSLVSTVLQDMSQGNETAIFIDNAQRTALLRGLFDSYYHAIHPMKTVFDTNRGWTTRLDYARDPVSQGEDDLLRPAYSLDYRFYRALDPEKPI